MKSRLIPILLAGACASVARADFDPVALTPESYTFDIVVEASTLEALPYCINVTVGNGTGLGDNTYYEQGLYARPGQPGANSGVPKHNTTFNSINNANMSFLMPPDYTVENDLMIDNTFTTGTLTFTTPTTATNLVIVGCGGGGATTIGYTVTHEDSSTEVGTIAYPDWFNNNADVVWGANGRITKDGGYNNYNSSSVNNNAPFLHKQQITVSDASPVTSIAFTYTSGAHGNIFCVSGNASGASWTPIPVSGFNVKALVPAAFPLTATMDQGTNTAYNGNLATWFEDGFVRGVGAGLPPSGTIFNSQSQPTHHYQMGDYSANNAILIDTNHQTANITPATPASYSTFALLTAGGNVGGTPMTNLCILQHANGVNETNVFLGYDWFYGGAPGAIALKGNGRVNMASRTVNNVGNNFPYLFETYFTVNETASPVTNILVQYKWAGNASSTTYIMALSGASGGVGPIVNVGPVPGSQTFWPGETASFTASASGTAPISGYWMIEENGVNIPLVNGLSTHGSIISGAQTTTLTVSNLFAADGTNYHYFASNAFGTDTSPAGVLIVRPQTITITPATPVFYTSNDIPLKVNLSGGPAVGVQWYYLDEFGVTNNIPGATNVTYTIVAAPLTLNGFTYGVCATNLYGTNTADVILSISDSAAFLAGDLSPLNAEAYAGAPVTYSVNAQGNSPMSYQWLTNGVIVGGVNANSLTLPAPCGLTTIQASFSNELSGGLAITTSLATLQGDPYPTNITFNVDGTGWQTNGSAPNIATNVLQLTSGAGGQASSAFFKTAQYVGGAWTASFIYSAHGGGADGTAFVLQTTNATALGGTGGQLGYGGIPGRSLAFQINLFGGNNLTPGIGLATDGITGIYQSAAPVVTTTTNDIQVTLNWANGVLAATLTDLFNGATYTTNYVVGSLVSVLGGNVAYVGFTGADGGITSRQTVSNFQFHSVLPPVALSVSPVTGNTFVLSWPAADPTYVLQATTSLTGSWGVGPTPVEVSGTNQVTVNVTAAGQQFYRLIRQVCN